MDRAFTLLSAVKPEEEEKFSPEEIDLLSSAVAHVMETEPKDNNCCEWKPIITDVRSLNDRNDNFTDVDAEKKCDFNVSTKNRFPQTLLIANGGSHLRPGNRDREEKLLRRERTYSCPICDKELLAQRSLNLHMMMHSGEKPYKCPKCDERFRQHGHVSRHIMMKHGAVKPHGCLYCQKKFVSKADSRQHERIHTGEKPFKCHLCEEKYSQKIQLNMHILRWHMKIKPRNCVHCTKQFVTRGELNQHLWTHTEEKHFKCAHCEKSFKFNRSRRQHEKLYHCGNITWLFPQNSTTTGVDSSSYYRKEHQQTDISAHKGHSFSAAESCRLQCDIATKSHAEGANDGEFTNNYGESTVSKSMTKEKCEISATFHDFSTAWHQSREMHYSAEKRFNQPMSNTSPNLNSDSGLSTTNTKNSIPAGSSAFVSSAQSNNNCKMRSNALLEASHLQQHSLTHGDTGQLLYKCDECPATFSDYRGLLWHQIAHA